MSFRVTLFIPDAGFERQFLASTETVPLLEDLAGQVAEHAADHVRRRYGHLADSIEVEVGLDTDDVRTGRVNANDFKAHFHEFGTRKLRADPYLRPAAEAVVGPVRGGDK